MKTLILFLIILPPFITINAQMNSWDLIILQKMLANDISYETGPNSGKFIAEENNEFLIIEVKLENKKDVDSTLTVEEIFVKDIQSNKRYNLKAISMGKYSSAFLISMLKKGRVIQIEKGGSYEIGRDNENEAMEIKFFDKISTSFLFFEVPKASNRRIQLYFGDSNIQIE